MKCPNVGFGVLMVKKNKVLLGLRNSDAQKADSKLRGEGTWTCPGGKLDFGEKLIDGVKREVKEETNLIVKVANIVSVTDNILEDVHFVTIGFICRFFTGRLKVMEPDEITHWKWFGFKELPENLYLPSKELIRNYLSKKIYKL